jgi:hypothetical protein
VPETTAKVNIHRGATISPSAATDQSAATTRRPVGDFRAGLAWARSVLDDPSIAAVQASGMSAADLDAIAKAARGDA